MSQTGLILQLYIVPADGLISSSRTFRLIFHELYLIYATSINNPCFVLFVHVHKMYQDALTTRAVQTHVARGRK